MPEPSDSGARCSAHGTGARCPLPTSASFTNNGVPVSRARAKASSSGASTAIISQTGVPLTDLAEAFKNPSASGLRSVIASLSPIKTVGIGSEVKMVSASTMQPLLACWKTSPMRSGVGLSWCSSRLTRTDVNRPGYRIRPCTSQDVCGRRAAPSLRHKN